MKKLDFPLFADVFFYSIATGILTLCVVRYFRVPLALSILVSLLLSAAVGIAVFLFTDGRHKKRAFTQKQENDYQALMLHLALEKPERTRALLVEAFTQDGRDAHCTEDCFTVDGIPYLPLFTMQPISADRIALFLREYGSEQFTVVCNALSPEAEQLLARFGKSAILGRELYALMERTQTYPQTLICGEIPRRTVKEKLAFALSRRNARPFFISGSLLLLMSLFTFFPLYYLISGGILLLTSCAIRIFAKRTQA